MLCRSSACRFHGVSAREPSFKGEIEHTSRISTSLSEPWMSCLFAKTSSDAPARRCAQVVRWQRGAAGGADARPRAAGRAAPRRSHACACGRPNQRPTQSHPFVRSSCASKAGACVAHRRPLVHRVRIRAAYCTTIHAGSQMLSVYLVESTLRYFAVTTIARGSLAVHEGLDVEAERGADA